MKCRFCHAELSRTVLDLGTAPPSNAYLSLSELSAPELWLPLRLLVCDTCWLVQTEDFTRPEDLFSAGYAYFSSTSPSWLTHAALYATEMRRRFSLGAESLVCEIAANDGYLLKNFLEVGIPCYGVEPTSGTATAARNIGIDIVQTFLSNDLAKSLVANGRSADLIAANNVLAHVPDINDFVRSFTTLLKPQGVATFEFPHLVCMITKDQFDTAYHEHYSYLSFTTAKRIFEKNGLRVFDVEQYNTHGGSIRVFTQRADTGRRPATASVDMMLHKEAAQGIETPNFYLDFQSKAEKIRDDLLMFLITAKRSATSVAAYGAAAKGNTLLNFAGVKTDLLPFVVDRAPSKQGMYLPGSRIPIYSEEQIFAVKPDYVLVLPWNLKQEIMTQLQGIRDWGARFVTATPSLTIE